MPNDEVKLLPCPFCGWDDMDNGGLCHAMISEDNPSEVVGPSGVCCPNCSAYAVGGMDDDEAIAAWNRRAIPSTVSGETVPDGWKLVPIEPTDAMTRAGAIAAAEVPPMRNRDQANAAYCAMIAASPANPAETQAVEVGE